MNGLDWNRAVGGGLTRPYARGADVGEQWVFDVTGPTLSAGADRMTLAVGGTDAVIWSKAGHRCYGSPLMTVTSNDAISDGFKPIGAYLFVNDI